MNSSHYKFRLYVAGSSPNSTSAIVNLQSFCDEYLSDRYEVEVINVLRQPERALADGILLTPLLVKISPEPVCRLIGSLSERDSFRRALGYTAKNKVTTVSSCIVP